MLCSEDAANYRRIFAHTSVESAYCKDTCPKASVPAFGQWLEIHPAESKLRIDRYSGFSATHGLAPALRLGLSKQVMVEIGRFRPKPSPCLNKGRCSLRWSYPDTRVRVARNAALYALPDTISALESFMLPPV